MSQTDIELFELAKESARKGHISDAIKYADLIIDTRNENCCLGIFIMLRIKKAQNILIDIDVNSYIILLTSCNKITKSFESGACIKMINKFLLSSERPKTKTIKLITYDDSLNKIIKCELPWNFSLVDETVGGSAIVKIDDIPIIAELGFSNIISLLETNHSKEFIEKCKKYNINVHHFSVVDREPPSHEQLDKILEIIFTSSKSIVHCLGGRGRTNVVLSSYLIKKDNISPAEAMAILDKQRSISLAPSQVLFIKRYYGMCNTPKYEMKVNKISLPGLIMTIGCPCSGKTTFSLELLTHYDQLIHLSMDELGKKDCEELFSKKAKNNNIILDNCNPTKEKRREWITSYRQLTDKKIWAIFFDINVDVCKERVKSRENHPTLSGIGGQKIIEEVYKKIEVPTSSEGFAEIITIRNDNDLILAKNKFGFGFYINCDNITKFPKTNHIVNLGAMSRDDKIFTQKELNEFLSMDVIVEEKVDGANLGIFYDHTSNKIKAQNRSHFVDSDYHAQFKLLDKWILNHTSDLMTIFDKGSYIIYGEWVYFKHSINYTKLPDYFVAYDIYDRVSNTFMSRDDTEKMLENTTIKMVPIIFRGKTNLDRLKALVNTESKFYNGPIEGIYVRAFENGMVKYRGKIVRQNFICGDVDGNVNHWTKGIHTINKTIFKKS